MPTVNELQTATTTAPKPKTAVTKDGNGQLGKDDFLKLFVAQLQHQDPMNPMEDSQFMGQMASFSTLEQISKMAAANDKLASQMSLTGSVGLLGRTVSYTDPADKSLVKSGPVEKVATVDGKTVLTVGGVAGVDPTSITQIA